MDRIVILGTANAVSDETHENSHLIITIGGSYYPGRLPRKSHCKNSEIRN